MCSPYPRCPNQTEYTEGIPAWKFDSDPDIAGIGVITSFFVYAILTNLLAFYAYFFADGLVPDDFYNNLDSLMRTKAQSLLKFSTERRIWHNRVLTIRAERLQTICLQLTDIQLITGASILIILYSTHCTITQYHFFVGSQLAYLSFVTFQAIFMTITDHLQESLPKRLWRYLWILVMFGAVLPTRILAWNSYFLVEDLYGASVQCALDKITQGWDRESALFVTVECFMLLWSFWAITVSLFPHMPDLPPFVHIQIFIHWALSWPSRHLLRAQSPDSPARKKVFWTVIFFIIIPCREFVFSEGFDILRMYVMLMYAGDNVISVRAEAAHQGRQGDENKWGFGQVLPVLLLAIPFAQFMEELCRIEDAPSTRGNFSTGQRRLSSHTIPGRNREYYELAAASNRSELARAWTTPSHLTRRQRTLSWSTRTSAARRVLGIEARALTAEDEMQHNLDQLEKSFFEDGIFQAWMIFLFLSVYAVSTWATLSLGVPF